MMAVKKPTNRGQGRGSRGGGGAFLANGARAVGSFALARPGSVALVLLFGGLGAAVSANALWMQTAHHPAPFFKQASLQAPLPPTRKVMEQQAAAGPAAALSEEASVPVLPPARPNALGKPAEPSAAAPAKPAPGKHPKDPIADLLGGSTPVPPAPVKASPGKVQTTDKSAAARPAPAHPSDALANLIEQTSKGR